MLRLLGENMQEKEKMYKLKVLKMTKRKFSIMRYMKEKGKEGKCQNGAFNLKLVGLSSRSKCYEYNGRKKGCNDN